MSIADIAYYTDFAELEESLSTFKCGKHLLSFLKCMLHHDKKKRSTPGNLLKHPYAQIGKEFYEKGTINMTQLLSVAVDARLTLLSAIKRANEKTMKLRSYEKKIFLSGTLAGVAGQPKDKCQFMTSTSI